jgi:hypothetical protein
MMPRSLSTFVKIANRCLSERPKERPTMMEALVELVHALSLQETGKQNRITVTEKLLHYFSVKPPPIPGNDGAAEATPSGQNDFAGTDAVDRATEAAPTDQADELVEKNNPISVAAIQLDELKEITN